MKKPKPRIKVAPSQKAHKTKKDYDREDNKLTKFVCHRCKAIYFAYEYIKTKDLPTCMGCREWSK